MEDVLSLEVKNNTLNNVKSKLESSMDDLEDELLMEKKSKTILEKEKRRLEGDLARCLEVVEEKEKETGAVRQSLTKREKELSHLVAKLEEEQQVILRNVRQVKELAGRVEQLEEELDTERQQRVRAEQQRSSINQELEEMTERLRDCSGEAASQTEAGRRREQEMARVRRDLEEEHRIYQNQMEALKRNYQQSISDLSEKLRSNEVLIQRCQYCQHQSTPAPSLSLGWTRRRTLSRRTTRP